MLRFTLIIIRILGGFLAVNVVKCSIDGLSYMDPINMRPRPQYLPGEDPCHPLYWYPRHIPEYCQYSNFPIPPKPAPPAVPMPIPVPVPPSPPSFPMPIPIPPPPPIMMPMPALPVPTPLGPIPFGSPFVPNNLMYPPISSPMLPASTSYANPELTGMVPGLPGLVTKDGGINILPFSDAYSDLIENHKNKMIRRRLNKLIKEYEDFPSRQSYRRLSKYARRNM